MKKSIGMLILLSIFSCVISKNETKSDAYNEYNLKGNVRSVKTEMFQLVSIKDTFRISENTNNNSLLQFNNLGNLISDKKINFKGKIIDSTTYTYDGKNRLIKKIGSVYNSNYIYSKDSLIQINEGFKRVFKFKRDNKNRLIKSEIIQNDTVAVTFILEYDKENNIIIENEYIGKNIHFRLLKRTFKKNLKLKEQVIGYRDWDTLFYENKFFYNKKRKLILENRNIDNDTTYDKIEYTYHKNGKLKQYQITPINTDIHKVITFEKYNENEDLIKSTLKHNEDEPNVWTYILKYDINKNWIEKIKFKNKEPLTITKRNIQYYK